MLQKLWASFTHADTWQRDGGWGWWVVAALVVVCCTVGLRVRLQTWQALETGVNVNCDFHIVRRAAVDLVGPGGADPYVERTGFVAALAAGYHPAQISTENWCCLYPPFTLLAMRPFATLKPPTAARLWGWLNLGMLMGGCVLVGWVMAPGQTWVAAILPALGALTWPVRFNYYLGNSEAFVLLMTAMGAALLVARDRSRRTAAPPATTDAPASQLAATNTPPGDDAPQSTARGWWPQSGDWLTALPLAMATAGKVLPAGFLVVAALRPHAAVRRWAIAGLLIAAGMSLAACAWVGRDITAAYWEASAIKSRPPHAFAAWPFNQSLNGFLHRHWSANSVDFEPVAERPELIPVVWWAWVAVVLGVAIAVEQTRGERASLTGGLALGVATTMLVSPFTENYYAVNMLLPAAWLLGQWNSLPGRPRVAVAVVGLAAAWLIGLGGPDVWLNWEGIYDPDPQTDPLISNLLASQVGLGMMLLWVAVVATRLCDGPWQTTGAATAVDANDGPQPAAYPPHGGASTVTMTLVAGRP